MVFGLTTKSEFANRGKLSWQTGKLISRVHLAFYCDARIVDPIRKMAILCAISVERQNDLWEIHCSD
jgi:hypothetical protein